MRNPRPDVSRAGLARRSKIDHPGEMPGVFSFVRKFYTFFVFCYNHRSRRKGGTFVKIHTSYVILIQRQLTAAVDKKTGQLQVTASRMVDDRLMRQTADVCLQALTFCVSVFQKEWDGLSRLSGQLRKNAAEKLIHSTRDNTARYPGVRPEIQELPFLHPPRCHSKSPRNGQFLCIEL